MLRHFHHMAVLHNIARNTAVSNGFKNFKPSRRPNLIASQVQAI
jgi:hypothetical protein